MCCSAEPLGGGVESGFGFDAPFILGAAVAQLSNKNISFSVDERPSVAMMDGGVHAADPIPLWGGSQLVSESPLARATATSSKSLRGSATGLRRDWLLSAVVAVTAALVFSVVLAAISAAQAQRDSDSATEHIELIVPLKQGRFYSSRAVVAECVQKLPGANHSLEAAEDRILELSAIDRAALIAAKAAGLIDFEFLDDRLVLRIPNREADAVRRRNRQRLGALLGVPLTEWPADKGLHLPADFNPDRRTMLLLHGLESDLASTQSFVAACGHCGIQAITFDYPNDGPVAWSGDRLRADLRRLAAQHPKLRVAIVAHSMGGLVARHCLEVADGGPPSCVTDLFCLGTPHQGTVLASQRDLMELAGEAMPSLWPRDFANLKDGLGEAGDDLMPGSAFLQKLNHRGRPRGIRYRSAIGQKGFLTPEQLQDIERELRSVFERRAVSAATGERVLRLVRCDEIRSVTGDGVVAVASARIEGGASERLFELNHVELLKLPGPHPEQHELFRWIMRELGWACSARQQHVRQ